MWGLAFIVADLDGTTVGTRLSAQRVSQVKQILFLSGLSIRLFFYLYQI